LVFVTVFELVKEIGTCKKKKIVQQQPLTSIGIIKLFPCCQGIIKMKEKPKKLNTAPQKKKKRN